MSVDGEVPERVVIGLSFGNSNSSIAATLGGDAKVIANEEGDRQIPSILSYVEGEEFHGTQAKAQLVRNPNNTCGGFRDFLGKKFEEIDPTPAHNSAHPFAHESTVAFSIRDTEAEDASTLTISEITKRHLRRLQTSASDYLGRQVTAAVVTIPTDFTEAQRQALTQAASATGLEILQLIPEPVASLLAHERRNVAKGPVDKTVVVADLGGTRSDITVVSVRGGMYTILATTHDFTLGGVQLDAALMDYFAKEYLKKNKNASDPQKNQRSQAKLRLESEAVKKALSLGSSAGFNVESLSDGLDFSATINRSRFELLASKTFASFTRLVESAVTKAGLDPLNIDEILVTGGTAHIPRIAHNLQAAFPESTTVVAPATDAAAINPSELTVRGAALQAYLIQDFDAEDIEQSTHPAVTATPHLGRTLGLVLADDPSSFHPLLQAETPLPVRRTATFTLKSTSESGALLKLVEAETTIKVTAPPPRPSKEERRAAAKAAGLTDDDDEDDDDEDEDEEEDEPLREKEWQAGATIAELALRDVKKGAKITVQVSVGADLDVSLSAMEVGGKGGVRGQVPGPAQGANGGAPNGSAH